ncbi:MAG: GNAT family N-acetyltransferase [Butyrivibrio sp.]|nr:GNAT family N-acetyltransferase [Butyrivibrio sp.]
MNEFFIRSATPNDAGELLQIYDYYVRETAVTYEYVTPSPEEFRERIEKTLKKYPYLVVEEKRPDGKKGRLLGYAYASAFHEREAYKWCVELSVYLDKDSRRQGIGRKLYDELERMLGNMGFLNLNACIAMPDSEDEHLTLASIRFHEKMGFSMVGEFHKCGFKFDRWYNMVWMEKLIGEHNSTPPQIKTI